MTDAVFVMALIPIFNLVIYPLFDMMGLFKKPLQRMALGSVLMSFAYVLAGMLELQLQVN